MASDSGGLSRFVAATTVSPGPGNFPDRPDLAARTDWSASSPAIAPAAVAITIESSNQSQLPAEVIVRNTFIELRADRSAPRELRRHATDGAEPIRCNRDPGTPVGGERARHNRPTHDEATPQAHREPRSPRRIQRQSETDGDVVHRQGRRIRDRA